MFSLAWKAGCFAAKWRWDGWSEKVFGRDRNDGGDVGLPLFFVVGRGWEGKSLFSANSFFTDFFSFLSLVSGRG